MALSKSPDDKRSALSRREALTMLGFGGLFASLAPVLLPTEAEAQPWIEWGGRRRRGWRRRELQRRCRDDWRFRRRNRDLCRHAWRRGRPGGCVEIGPVLLCD
jgi:hypothetical protein